MKHFFVCLLLASTSMATTIVSVSCSARSNETLDSHKIESDGSVSCFSAFGDGHAESSASALVTYGQIRTYAQALVIPSNGDVLDHAGASVLAQYDDTLTIMGSGSGTMRVLLIFPGPTQTGSTAAFEMGDRHASQGSPFMSPIPSPIVTLLIPINFGEPISIKAWAGQAAHADVSNNERAEQVFSQIFTLLGSNGQAMQGFEYTSDGVTVIGGNRIADDPLPPIHTPEPASVITLAAACIGMLLRRRALYNVRNEPVGCCDGQWTHQ